MTSTVTELTRRAIAENSYYTLSGTFGLTAILLLAVLLIGAELVQAYDHPRSEPLNQTLNVAIVPLLLAFGLTMVLRLLELL